MFLLSRSFKRGSKSESVNWGVSDNTIDRNNRWRKVKRAGSRKHETLDEISLHESVSLTEWCPGIISSSTSYDVMGSVYLTK